MADDMTGDETKTAGAAEAGADAPPEGMVEGEPKTDNEKPNEELSGEGTGASEIEDYEEDLEDMDEESEEGSEEATVEIEQELPKDDFLEEDMWAEMEGEFEDEGEEEGEGQEIFEEEIVEEGVEEEGPPDPAAPYNLTDSSEALKAPFALSPNQFAEVQELWQLYQDYTPAYTELDNYVTSVELVYMLKALNLMTYTPEQMQELIDFCVRPPNEEGHVFFDHFVHMVTIRQRDMPIEEDIRLALEVMDPEKTGLLDREYVREVLGNKGYKMKTVDMFIKEVDMSNDGTLGIEDIVGTVCLDLNRDDIIMLYNNIYPPEEKTDNIDNLI
ncbi:uncharacterized protein LOC126366453 [Pectinophora gossypiella]|uniref:uncharacterized protein LOC126366453 n=1 Tax=Pectinophora gossypiella TaxID=13191 RepID=UPI00214EDA81|nr:uncharacterized protein LOC126366453 [Pectinophora gossypiella]